MSKAKSTKSVLPSNPEAALSWEVERQLHKYLCREIVGKELEALAAKLGYPLSPNAKAGPEWEKQQEVTNATQKEG